MGLITKRVYGSEDILPKDSYKWQFVEDIMRKESAINGFKEIRTPVFEHTELFQRGIGDNTDVVQKEMYTFDTKGGTSITLRPEGTAGAARAVLENAVYNDGLPVKVSYFVSCYRYEKKQAHRYREFHQFGLEVFGAATPFADAEMIAAAAAIFKRLGLKDISLELNSIGCPECRAKYYEELKNYFRAYTDKLCETCLSRLERNPMRILDCKSPVCSEIAKGAPKVLDYICDDCKEHFDGVKRYLDKACINYKINPTIVRGLDYYTRTVFEFVTASLGSQGTVCGGGRYDGLIEELGGTPMAGLGFAVGMERLIALMEEQKVPFPEPSGCDLYIASMGKAASEKAFELISQVRSSSLSAQGDIVGRSLRAQMKYADKIGAKYSIVLGDNEIDKGKAKLKNMATGKETEISLNEGFCGSFLEIHTDDEQNKIIEAAENMERTAQLWQNL